jgi:hypothetical protein
MVKECSARLIIKLQNSDLKPNVSRGLVQQFNDQ